MGNPSPGRVPPSPLSSSSSSDTFSSAYFPSSSSPYSPSLHGGSPAVCSLLERNLDAQKSLPPEVERGNVEYKLKLINYTEERYARLVSQMKWRLGEGSNMAIYEIGVDDDGTLVGLHHIDMDISLRNLKRMATEIGAEVTVLQQTTLENGNLVSEVMVRKIPLSRDFTELRIAMIGGTDAGKSTLLGVLTRGELDNGRGRSRLNLLSHRHEIETGKTSSICHELIGFDSKGGMVNYSPDINSWEQICEKASRVINFVDLAGSEKYLRTTINGMIGHSPNFVCLVVGAHTGVTSMTREHLEVAKSLDCGIFIVVTKIDCCTPATLQKSLNDIIALFASGEGEGHKEVTIVLNTGQADLASKSFSSSTGCVPVFLVSSVTGKNMNLLTRFLGKIENPEFNPPEEEENKNLVHFQVEEVYQNVPEVGVVVGGRVLEGKLYDDMTVLLGPDQEGHFSEVEIASIHRQRVPVSVAEAGHHATVAFKMRRQECPLLANPSLLRSGMSLFLDREGLIHPQGAWEFEASMLLLPPSSSDKSTAPLELSRKAFYHLHIGSIRQKVTVVWQDAGLFKFRFAKHPEFLRTGAKVFLRDLSLKMVGHVVRVC